MTLDELLARFAIEYQAPNSIYAGRREAQLIVLRRLSAGLDHPLTELTAADLRGFVGTEIERGLNPRSVRLYLGMVKSFVQWAHQAGFYDAALTAELRSVPNPRGSGTVVNPKPYKVSEVHALYAIMREKYPALPTRGKGKFAMSRFMRGKVPKLHRHLYRHVRRLQFEAQFSCAVELGMRTVEIHRLTIPAMHPENEYVVVATAKKGPGTSSPTRAIPHTDHSRAVFEQWLDMRSLLPVEHEHPWLRLHPSLALSVQVQPMPYTQYHSSLAVFPGKWEWHRLRHTAITEWLRSGVPLEKVRVFAGHSDINMTLAYAEILDSDVQGAFEAAQADFAKRMGLAA